MPRITIFNTVPFFLWALGTTNDETRKYLSSFLLIPKHADAWHWTSFSYIKLIGEYDVRINKYGMGA
jgi:hypothetical protein